MNVFFCSFCLHFYLKIPFLLNQYVGLTILNNCIHFTHKIYEIRIEIPNQITLKVKLEFYG
jgi:hypothetical protein